MRDRVTQRGLPNEKISKILLASVILSPFNNQEDQETAESKGQPDSSETKPVVEPKTEQPRENIVATTPESLPFSTTPQVLTFADSFSGFSPDGTMLATYKFSPEGDKATTTIWDVKTGRSVWTIQGYNAQFSSDGKYLMTAYQVFNTERRISYQGRVARRNEAIPGSFLWIKLYDIARKREVFSEQVNDVRAAISPDSKLVSVDGWVREIATGKKLYQHPTGQVQFLQNNTLLVALYGSESLLYSTSGNVIRRFDGCEPQMCSDGTMVFTFGEKINGGMLMNGYRLWDIETGRVLYRIDGSKLSLSPVGNIVATVTGGTFEHPDRFVVLWNVRDGKELKRFAGGLPLFSPDGKLLLSTVGRLGDNSVKLYLWDIAKGSKLQEFDGGKNWFSQSGYFSPDGKSLCIINLDDENETTTLRIYDHINLNPTP